MKSNFTLHYDLQLIAEKAAAAVANGTSKPTESAKEKKPEGEQNGNIGFSINWKKLQFPCMLPAVTDDTSSSSDDDKSANSKAYSKPAGSSPKTSYTADEASLRNRAFVANKK